MTWHLKSSLTVETLHWTSSNLDSVPNFPVLFLLRSGKTLMLSLVQEWLDTRNATLVVHFLDTSVRGGSWCTDSSLSPLLVKLPQVLESSLPANPLKAAVTPFAWAPFPTTLFPSSQLSMNMLWYSTLWTASPFSGLPSSWRVSMSVFWTTVKSAVFPMIVVVYWTHDCGCVYWTRLRHWRLRKPLQPILNYLF